jgi:NAD(P)H-dependent flavin oxidoreductase YrpB (nitropropane dioxygenase family)
MDDAYGRASELPPIIQGGMGVAISNWKLARAVASAGQLGVVSGTALDTVLVRRLQDGDPDGDVRRAMAAFPYPEIAARLLHRYFREGGRNGEPYTPAARHGVRGNHALDELAVVANFVEVWLAKEGHDGQVGINFLEKIQLATPSAAYGALLAGADAVLMGAGIPRQIPRLLDDLAAGRPGHVDADVAGGDAVPVVFDPASLGRAPATLPRPPFLAIVSAHVLATLLCRNPETTPDGFVVEGPDAGGHNAPPRGKLQLDADGEPIYGPKDAADPAALVALGLPFWMAGGYGDPEGLRRARALGATGVQIGTVFALCQDSGLRPDLRQQLLEELRGETLHVRTSTAASPTGFPFKVADLPGTLADAAEFGARPRLCDMGYLRKPFRRENGAIGFRCPAEPVDVFIRKGGTAEETVGAVCLCNGRMASAGYPQTRKDGYTEPPVVTLGSDLTAAQRLDSLHWLSGGGQDGWSAADVISWLLGGIPRQRSHQVEVPAAS